MLALQNVSHPPMLDCRIKPAFSNLIMMPDFLGVYCIQAITLHFHVFNDYVSFILLLMLYIFILNWKINVGNKRHSITIVRAPVKHQIW